MTLPKHMKIPEEAMVSTRAQFGRLRQKQMACRQQQLAPPQRPHARGVVQGRGPVVLVRWLLMRGEGRGNAREPSPIVESRCIGIRRRGG